MRTPDDPHPRPPPRLHPGHRVLEDQTLLRPDRLLALRQRRIDRLQRQQVDVRRRLAPAPRYARVVSQHAPRRGEDAKQVRQVARLELEVDRVAARRERHVCAGRVQVHQQPLHARQRDGGREQLPLVLGRLGVELLGRDGQLRPFLQDRGRGGARAALQLGLDAPGERGAAVPRKQVVGADCVEIFGVQEETVHVEETGADRGEPGRCVS